MKSQVCIRGQTHLPFTSDNQLMEFRNNIDQRQQVEKLEMKGLILFLDMYM